MKSVSYEHESEVRAVYWNIPGYDMTAGTLVHPPGLFIPINLRALITDVVVSPLAPAWFAPLVRSTIERYEFSLTITPSMTSRDAVY